VNPVSEDIKDKLVAGGIGTFATTSTSVWNIYIDDEPDQPDQTITIYDTSAGSPDRFLNHSRPLHKTPFQIRVRGNAYLATHNTIKSVETYLDQISTWVASGPDSADPDVNYESVFLDSGPFSLGKDATKRFIWVATFTAHRQEKP